MHISFVLNEEFVVETFLNMFVVFDLTHEVEVNKARSMTTSPELLSFYCLSLDFGIILVFK